MTGNPNILNSIDFVMYVFYYLQGMGALRIKIIEYSQLFWKKQKLTIVKKIRFVYEVKELYFCLFVWFFLLFDDLGTSTCTSRAKYHIFQVNALSLKMNKLLSHTSQQSIVKKLK